MNTRRKEIEDRKTFLTMFVAGDKIPTKYDHWYHDYLLTDGNTNRLLWPGKFAARTSRMINEQECEDWQQSAASVAYSVVVMRDMIDNHHRGIRDWMVVKRQHDAADYYNEARTRLLTLLDKPLL